MLLIIQVLTLLYLLIEGPIYGLLLTTASVVATGYGIVFHLRYRHLATEYKHPDPIRSTMARWNTALVVLIGLIAMGVPYLVVRLIFQSDSALGDSNIYLVVILTLLNIPGLIYWAVALTSLKWLRSTMANDIKA